jgi:hypothetical protein
LHAHVCEGRLLVQLEQFQSPEEIFGDYAYFSSYPESWLSMPGPTPKMIRRFGSGVTRSSRSRATTAICCSISAGRRAGAWHWSRSNVAKEAERKGIPSLVKFFGTQTAKILVAQGTLADLLLGNNVSPTSRISTISSPG